MDTAEQEQVEAIPPQQYYAALMKMLNLSWAAGEVLSPLPPQAMIERLLRDGVPIETVMDKAAMARGLPDPHRRKMREALEWKKAQLQARSAVFGNVN